MNIREKKKSRRYVPDTQARLHFAAEILHVGGHSLSCGIARAIPWTRLAEKKCFANL